MHNPTIPSCPTCWCSQVGTFGVNVPTILMTHLFHRAYTNFCLYQMLSRMSMSLISHSLFTVSIFYIFMFAWRIFPHFYRISDWGIVHPKMKIIWQLAEKAIQDADEFVFSSEQIWRNVALHHFSAMDALQWMGAVRIRVQTADKNITIIHVLWREKLSSLKDFQIQTVASG